MKFITEDAHVLHLLADFLGRRGLYETLSSLKLETNVGNPDESLNDELIYLERLTLQGRWVDVIEFVRPLNDLLEHYEEVELVIRRQQYLEALCWQGGGAYRHALLPWKPPTAGATTLHSAGHALEDQQIDVEAVVTLLKSIECICSPQVEEWLFPSKVSHLIRLSRIRNIWLCRHRTVNVTIQEFSSLCDLLTLERLADHPSYTDWTVSRGRLECFSSLKQLLYEAIQGRPLPDRGADGQQSVEGSSLQSLIAMGLAYQRWLSCGAQDEADAVLSTRWEAVGKGRSYVRTLVAEGVASKDILTPYLPSLKLINPIATGIKHLLTDKATSTSSTSLQHQKGQAVVSNNRNTLNEAVEQRRSNKAIDRPNQVHSTSNIQSFKDSHVNSSRGNNLSSGESAEASSSRIHEEEAASVATLQSVTRAQSARQSPMFVPPSGEPRTRATAGAAVERVEWSKEEEADDVRPVPSIHISADNESEAMHSGSNRSNFVEKNQTPRELVGTSNQSMTSRITPPTPASVEVATTVTALSSVTANQQHQQQHQHPAPPNAKQERVPVAWTVPMDVTSTATANGQINEVAVRKPRSTSAGRDRATAHRLGPTLVSNSGESHGHNAPPHLPIEAPTINDNKGGTPNGYYQQHEQQLLSQASPAATPLDNPLSNGPLPVPSAGLRSTQNQSYLARGPNVIGSTGSSSIPGSRSQLPTPVSATRQTRDPSPSSALRARNTSAPNSVRPEVSSAGKVRSGGIASVSDRPFPPGQPTSSLGNHSSSEEQKAAPKRSASSERHGTRSDQRRHPWDRALASTGRSSGKERTLCAHRSTLYETDVPLRCVSVLDAYGAQEEFISDAEFDFALGSNARYVKTMRYSPLTDLRDGPRSSGSVSAYSNASAFGGSPAGASAQIGSGVTAQLHEYTDLHRGSVYCMDFSASTRLLATASNDKTLRIINVETNAVSQPLRGHTGTVRSLRFQTGHADSSSTPILLASAGAGDFRPRIWDVATGSVHSQLYAHAEAVHGLAWLGSNLLLSGCERGCIIAHDIRTAAPAWTLDLSLNSFVAAGGAGICALQSLCAPWETEEASLVVAGITGGLACVVDPQQRRMVAAQKIHGDDVRGLAIFHRSVNRAHRDSDAYILSTSFDTTAAVWKIDLSEGAPTAFIQKACLQGHTDKVLGAAIVGPSQQVVTTGADGNVILWTPFF